VSRAERRSDADLLSGDPEAFGVFYRRHEAAVLGFFRHRTGSSETAADLTAETFARALEGRARFDRALGDGRGWLFGIARHLLARSLEGGRVEDEVRRRLGLEPLVLGDAALARIDALAGDPALAALAGLPDDQRLAVAGRVLEAKDYARLAEELRCSQSVARKRVSRGLRTLLAALRESA
jgi:DNA-directed RNA polymerase specialized sigma24 family protein